MNIASSVLVCNNQMFLYGVEIRWLPCDSEFTLMRESGYTECEANGTTQPCLKSLLCDRNKSNKKNANSGFFTQPFTTNNY